MSSFTPQDSAAAAEESAAESPSSLKKLRVKEIKARLEKLQVDYSKCVEKSDLVSLLSKSLPTSKSDKIDWNIERLRIFVTDKIIKNDDVEPSVLSVRARSARILILSLKYYEYHCLYYSPISSNVTKSSDTNARTQVRREMYRSAMCRINQMRKGVSRFSLVQRLLDTCRLCRPEDEAILLAMIPDGMGSDVYVMFERYV